MAVDVLTEIEIEHPREDQAAIEAAELSPKSHRRRDRRPRGVKTERPATTQIALIRKTEEWRDAESNRGHRDFQAAARIRGLVPICRTSSGGHPGRVQSVCKGHKGILVPTGSARAN
jgi:hypothetical protein